MKHNYLRVCRHRHSEHSKKSFQIIFIILPFLRTHCSCSTCPSVEAMLVVLLTTFTCSRPQWSLGESLKRWWWWHPNLPTYYSWFISPLCFSHPLPWLSSFKLWATTDLASKYSFLFQQLSPFRFCSTTGTSPIQILGFSIQLHSFTWIAQRLLEPFLVFTLVHTLENAWLFNPCPTQPTPGYAPRL